MVIDSHAFLGVILFFAPIIYLIYRLASTIANLINRFFINPKKKKELLESLGAVETMITHPATMTHADVPKDEREARGLTDGLVRLSVGIENPDDIIADLEQALNRV